MTSAEFLAVAAWAIRWIAFATLIVSTVLMTCGGLISPDIRKRLLRPTRKKIFLSAINIPAFGALLASLTLINLTWWIAAIDLAFAIVFFLSLVIVSFDGPLAPNEGGYLHDPKPWNNQLGDFAWEAGARMGSFTLMCIMALIGLHLFL